MHLAVSLIQNLLNVGLQQTAAEYQGIPRPSLLSRTGENLPCICPQRLKKQQFHRGAGAFAAAVQPSRQHPAVVENQAVSRFQEGGQIIKMLVRQSAALTLHHQHPRMIPWLNRFLGDPLRRKLKIKIAFIHNKSPSFRGQFRPADESAVFIPILFDNRDA